MASDFPLLRRRIGATGPEVSALGLGTMAFASPSADPDECVALVHRALDHGIDLVDTADAYGDGTAEELVGRALVGRRDRVVLATKVGLPMQTPVEGKGLSAGWIATACEQSLRRLGTDHIDLYQLHRPDPATPIEDTVEAIGALLERGLVRHWGTSVLSADMVRDVCAVADGLGVARPVADQLPYSLLVRSREAQVVPALLELGMGALVWSPLTGGWLTGKYRPGEAPPEGSRGAREGTFVFPTDEAKLGAVAALTTIADEHGVSLTALALARVAAEPGVASVLLGPRTSGQLTELLAAAGEQVPASALAAVDAVVAPGTSLDPRNDAWPEPAAFTHRTGA
jgi:aryl-alcohol dehydrogenase-like predicted oxidoreductase